MNKNWQKIIRSLQLKKIRKKEGLFMVEGRKNVLELLGSDFEKVAIFFTNNFGVENHRVLSKMNCLKEETSISNLEKNGSLKSNNQAIAVAKIKENSFDVFRLNEVTIVLDDIRDPGNLGTIIRIADWYGIKNVICSPETADFYNPKVILASMGSFTRVSLFYQDLNSFFKKLPKNYNAIGAFMNGKNIHSYTFRNPTLIVMGNESNGISQGLEKYISEKVSIPSFGEAESLNVSVATAIFCDHFRQQIKA